MSDAAGEATQGWHRALRGPLLVLAAIVVVAAGINAAGGLVATFLFAALAAVLCRRLQLSLLERGVRPGIALGMAVGALLVVLAVLLVAVVAAIVAMAMRVAEDADRLSAVLTELLGGFAEITGLPPGAMPGIDVTMLVSGARGALGLVSPAVTGLAMAALIVAYLLLDADRLRTRLERTLEPGVLARYDALATELAVYIRVRALLGAAAAVADAVLLLLIGVPFALLWGALSFVFSFIPNLGFLLALVPPAVFAALELGPGPAVLVVAGYVAINLAFDYVLQPRVMSDSLDLSPVAVIVSILAWTLLIGASGALLAVPLTMVLRAVLWPYPGARWFVALLGPAPATASAGGPPAATTSPGGHGEPTIEP